jgi:hypothetical protein
MDRQWLDLHRRKCGMTGSTRDLILIAVVTVIALAAWIVLVFYVDTHPEWRRRKAPGGDADVTTAGKGHRSARGGLPQERSRPRRAGQRHRPSRAYDPSQRDQR